MLAPAIELAATGFPAWDGLIGGVEATARRVDRRAGRARASSEVLRPGGRPWRPGELVRLPALAATLARLADDGFDAFYDGDLAERQARGLAAAGSRHHRRGPRPRTVDLGRADRDRLPGRPGHHPPAEQLGVVALELLNILERFEPPPPCARSGRPA